MDQQCQQVELCVDVDPEQAPRGGPSKIFQGKGWCVGWLVGCSGWLVVVVGERCQPLRLTSRPGT